MSIGIVLYEAWTLFTRFFLRFFVIGLVVFETINLPHALVVSAVSADNDGAAFALAILALVTLVIGTTWLQGAFVYAVQDSHDGTIAQSVVAPFSAVAIAIAYFGLGDAHSVAAEPVET